MSSNFIESIVERDLESGKCSQVVTRFPPEPNGYLHIGHAKSLCINFGIKAKYGGRCNLRFDDTNPVKEEAEYAESIKADIRWLGFEWDSECYASDYFDTMYECAELLISKGLAYVCDLTADEIRETRGTLTRPGTPSPFRDRATEENMRLFRAMRDGAFPDGSRVLRAKIDMASKNLNMRDPVLYRILRAAHHHTGDKWVIYPMYDFAHPIEDAVEGITHSICTLEFEDHRPLYDWVVRNCEFENPPHQYEFARLNVKNAIMSKRYLKKLVDSGFVDGWDDPRMPTLSGMRRRGYPPEAIRKFCADVGVAKANSEVDDALLTHCVRMRLNETAERAMVVEKPLRVIIENLEAPTEFEVENRPNAPEERHTVRLGREICIERDDFSVDPPPKYKRLTIGGTVRLKGAYVLRYLSHDEADGETTAVHCEYVPDSAAGGANAGMKVKGVVQWVCAEDAVRVELRKYGSLLLDADGKDSDFDRRLNPGSLETATGCLGEPRLADKEVGTAFQFIRRGYYKLAEKREDALVFHRIADLRDAYNRK